MKKFLCRCLTFVLVTFVICHLINPALNLYFEEGRNSRLNHRSGWIFGFKDQAFQFAVLGSSRTLNQVDVRTLEDAGIGRGINISNSGAGYAQNYLVLRRFFELNNRIDRLVLNFDRDCFESDVHFTDPFQEHAFLPFTGEKWVDEIFRDELRPSKYWLYRILPTSRYLEYNDRY
ncbi:MAG: hypothetical protein ACI9R3_002296 [Verrucomicrobiales bacterium]|jgi:hypothetical protein